MKTKKAEIGGIKFMKKTIKIAVGTLKGGVGKSSVIVTLGSILAEKGYKILICDGDAQANTSAYLRLDETAEGYKSIKNIYDDKNINPAEIVVHTEIENLDLIGSTIFLTENEGKLYNAPLGELYLKKYFNANTQFFNKYSYILFDTNPSMSKINQSIFATVDKIICITDVGIGGFKGLELFDYLLTELVDAADLNVKIEAIIINKVDNRTRMSKDYIDFLKNDELTKDIVLNNYIKASVKLAEAEISQTPINFHAPQCKSNKEYNAVIGELFEKGVL